MRRSWLLLACISAFAGWPALAIAEAPTGETADVFGVLHAQVTIVPASAFQPAAAGTKWILDGVAPLPTYLVTTDPGAGSEYVAAVPLPSGLRLEELRVYYHDTATNDLTVTLWRAAGAGPSTLLATAGSQGQAGSGSGSDTSLSHRVDSSGPAQLQLRLSLPKAATGTLKFRAAMLVWWRDVKDYSEPPCVASFDDVPCGSSGFNEVEAIREAGITVGCSTTPPLYCPDSPVTRGQMAVFLAKALGLYWAF